MGYGVGYAHGLGFVPEAFTYILSPRLHLKGSLLGRKKAPQVRMAPWGHPGVAYGYAKHCYALTMLTLYIRVQRRVSLWVWNTDFVFGPT